MIINNVEKHSSLYDRVLSKSIIIPLGFFHGYAIHFARAAKYYTAFNSTVESSRNFASV